MNATNMQLEQDLLGYPQINEPSQKLFDIERIIGVIRRNIWIVATIIGLALVAGVVITLLMTPQYTAEASVQINQETDRILDSEDVQPTTSYQDADRFLQTQLDILESRHIANRVAQAQKLFTDQAFLDLADIAPDEGLKGKQQAIALQESVLSYLQDHSTFTLPVDSRIVTVAFTSPSPELSARLANTFVSEYVQDGLDRKLKSSGYAREYLASELAEAKIRLEESERELNDYARSSGVVRITGDTDSSESTVTSRNLVQLNEAAAVSEAELAVATSRWQSASSIPASSLPEVINNGAYQALQAERARVAAQLNDQLQSRRDDHPQVKALRGQLSTIDSQMGSIAQSVKNGIRADYQAALNRQKTLNSRVNGLTDELIDEGKRSVRYNILAREVDTNRTIYDGLLQRFKEIGAQAGIASNNLSPVDPAVEPLKPSAPQPFLNMLLALIVGSALAVAAAFIREIIDDKLRTPRDVEERLGMPAIGLIPVPEGETTIAEELEDSKSSISEAIHSLRTNILVGMESSGSRILLFTSTEASEGKSTTALALAGDIGRLGRNVLLVDGDLRRPRAHKLLGVSRERHGLTDVIASPETVNEAIIRSDEHGIDVLLTGTEVSDPSMVFNSGRFATVLRELAERYDVVVIDAPPVLGLADAPSLARQADNVAFVVEAGRGRLRRVQHAISRLRSVGANVMGVVLTKVDFTADGYGYSYGYGYEYHRYDETEAA